MLNASFLSYYGPFDQEIRGQLTADYMEDIINRGMMIPEDFKVEQLLTSDVEISLWSSQGLPSDPVSVQNGILTSRASRYPFCIDPQQ